MLKYPGILSIFILSKNAFSEKIQAKSTHSIALLIAILNCAFSHSLNSIISVFVGSSG